MNCFRLPKESMAAIKEATSTSAVEYEVAGNFECQRKNCDGSESQKEETSYFSAKRISFFCNSALIFYAKCSVSFSH